MVHQDALSLPPTSPAQLDLGQRTCLLAHLLYSCIVHLESADLAEVEHTVDLKVILDRRVLTIELRGRPTSLL